MGPINLEGSIKQLIIKSGLLANINATATVNSAVEGEPHWATDTDDLYMFDGAANILLAGASGTSMWDRSSAILSPQNSGDTIKGDGGRIVNTTRVTTTYTILITDHAVFANTDGGAYTVTLPAGVEGQTFRIINSGSSGNNLTVAPNGAEDLLGANSSFTLADGETLILTYNSTDGWY